MSSLEDLVEKYGGIDKLTSDEKKVYFDHLKIIQGKVLTVDDVKKFVRNVITVLEKELVDAEEGSVMSLGLKGRLKNFLVLENYLMSPERAKAAVEKYYAEHKDQQLTDD